MFYCNMDAERRRSYLMREAKSVYTRVNLILRENCLNCARKSPHCCLISPDSVEFSILLEQAIIELKEERVITPHFSWEQFYQYFDFFFPNNTWQH